MTCDILLFFYEFKNFILFLFFETRMVIYSEIRVGRSMKFILQDEGSGFCFIDAINMIVRLDN